MYSLEKHNVMVLIGRPLTDNNTGSIYAVIVLISSARAASGGSSPSPHASETQRSEHCHLYLPRVRRQLFL
jgi:hypothetical protein